MALPISTATQKDYRDDLVTSSAPWGVDDTQIVPVKNIGEGIARNNNRQALKTYSILKSSVPGEIFYIQVATVTANTRIFYVGVQETSATTDPFYIEDASTGNIAYSDGGSVALADSLATFVPYPRECKRGIRVALTVSAASSNAIIVYYLEERTDGQLVGL